MCHAFITLYPCGHPVLVACKPCATGMHPQACGPRNVQVTTLTYFEAALKGVPVPPKCPATKHGRVCMTVPNDPLAFANFCMKHEMAIEDVVAVAPAWVFDAQGRKIGSKSFPYRVTDYITAFYVAKNPIAMRNRLSKPLREKTMTRKPASGARIGDENGCRWVRSGRVSKPVQRYGNVASTRRAVGHPGFEAGALFDVEIKEEN